ncbi:disks large-associated protein 5-like [Hydractinia symbiolongicarpus]|uniref:disks large-associated protein 5-like n=1 Tax=Hydractinia symbiolongicarpus TaxID=13093 RepID=UPI00254B48C3|nr:disks large-associated protein 5-like [Hydractinia symbiolongicarpus]
MGRSQNSQGFTLSNLPQCPHYFDMFDVFKSCEIVSRNSLQQAQHYKEKPQARASVSYMACLCWNPDDNSKYEKYVKDMEESLVKLRLAELAKIRNKAEVKENMPPINGTNQKDGKYYLVRLEMEKEKLNALIDAAERDARLLDLPEEAHGKVRNAVGKAQLLLSKRFKQFEDLCHDNIENDPDKKETKATDLLGYWDMMFIQIDDVSSLFVEIEKLKANNWISQDTLDGPTAASPNSLTPKTKRKTQNKSPRPKNKNNNTIDNEKVKREARNRLAAARKQAKLRQQQEQGLADDSLIINGGSLNSSLNGSTFNGDLSLNSSLNSSVELLSNHDGETHSPPSLNDGSDGNSPVPEPTDETIDTVPTKDNDGTTQLSLSSGDSQSPVSGEDTSSPPVLTVTEST